MEGSRVEESRSTESRSTESKTTQNKSAENGKLGKLSAEKSEFAYHTRRMLDFIEKSPSPFHVIANLSDQFANAGFSELQETDSWRLEPGGKYFVVRNGSSVIAFCVPLLTAEKTEKKGCRGFHIAAAHSDSPTFKIKENPVEAADKRYLKLNTEKYGGMILSTWLDRPLSIAGRVAVAGQAAEDEPLALVTKLVNLDRDMLAIPNVAIHMNRDMNKGVEYNPQIDMLPLFGEPENEKQSGESEEDQKSGDVFLAEIAAAAGVQTEEILGHDLFLYVRDKGRVFGRDGEFVLSPKLDDLQCVYAAAEALCTTVPHAYISLCAVFDNEEVGSRTRQGADSTFLKDTVERICEALCDICGESSAATLEKKWIADSFLISADNAHAVHPNHPEKADPTNRPYLNGGIVIKYHGGQKYTTDAVSAARMKALCKKVGVPCQTYANRSDIAGGSTLGNLSAGHLPVLSVDIGLPQLAMHSAVETGGAKDTAYAVKVLQEFFRE